MKRSMIREFHERVEVYEDGIDLTLGELDFPLDERIIEAACASLKNHEVGYSSTRGDQALIQKIIEAESKRGIDILPEQVLITHGASEALSCCLLSCLQMNDKVVAIEPAYPQYRNLCELVHAQLITCEVEQLPYILNDDIKMLILNTPHNPTGRVVKRHELNFGKWNGLIVLDEVYSDISYQPYQNLYSSLNNVILIRSFSKSYAMGGFRLGYLICDEKLCERLTLTHQSLVSCLPLFIQKAGIEALKHPSIPITELKKRKAFIADRLNKMNLSFVEPQGTFYLWIKIQKSKDFCERLLLKKHVALVPSEAFKKSGYVRLSYGGSFERLKIALDRIEAFVLEEGFE